MESGRSREVVVGSESGELLIRSREVVEGSESGELFIPLQYRAPLCPSPLSMVMVTTHLSHNALNIYIY